LSLRVLALSLRVLAQSVRMLASCSNNLHEEVFNENQNFRTRRSDNIYRAGAGARTGAGGSATYVNIYFLNRGAPFCEGFRMLKCSGRLLKFLLGPVMKKVEFMFSLSFSFLLFIFLINKK